MKCEFCTSLMLPRFVFLHVSAVPVSVIYCWMCSTLQNMSSRCLPRRTRTWCCTPASVRGTHTHTRSHGLLLHWRDVTPSVWLIEVCRLSDGITWPSPPLTALHFMKVTLMNQSCSGSHFLTFIELWRDRHTRLQCLRIRCSRFWCVSLKFAFRVFFWRSAEKCKLRRQDSSTWHAFVWRNVG